MRQRIVTLHGFVLVFTLGLALAHGRAHAGDAEFFFYSPQVGTGNLSQLKQTADQFFRDARVDLKFQPFARFEDLQREFPRRKPAFLMVPDWAAGNQCLGTRLIRVARPVREGRLFDRRALVATGAAHSPADMAGGSIAATVPTTTGGDIIDPIEQFRIENPGVRIIPVPKDIDALLAVGFGQVDGAFVSMTQFDMLTDVNPALTGSLHEIGYSVATPFPATYATEYADPEMIGRLRQALTNEAMKDSGRRLSGLLGYDGWRSDTSAGSMISPRSCDAEAGVPK